jgi:hypothetical protein
MEFPAIAPEIFPEKDMMSKARGLEPFGRKIRK